MEFDPHDRAALDRLVSELQELHGDALLAVMLSGEAAGPGYRPGRSPLTTVVMLEEVSPDALRRPRERGRGGQRKRLATPLLMDPPYLRSSLDVFPLEFLTLRDQHRVLHGRSDFFAALDIDLEHLRLEVEEQARGKLLHLWEAYLDAGPSLRRLRTLLMETPVGFETILRGMLHLAAARSGPDGENAEEPVAAGALAPEALLKRCEKAFRLELPVLRRLELVRQGNQELARADLEPMFEAYLGEVRRIARLADGL